MAIRVGNVRDYIRGGKAVLPEGAAYVGREVKRYGLKASPLASPFRIGEANTCPSLGDGKRLSRRGAVEAYRMALDYAPGEPVLTELARLRALASGGDLLLLCWCETWDGTGEAPGKCHAEVIREYLEAAR